MRRTIGHWVFCLVLALAGPSALYAQGFLHAEGKKIVDGNGENIILRGIGTGNWMIQEGYMMKSSDVAGTQHEFREKLVQTIGEAKTDSFYKAWLNSHFTRTDVDSLASWGFNSVRVAMHYKWFTLPIEEEPVPGKQTWLETGFTLIDSLLDWCGDNGMYLILDLHGAPGGQGKNASISDYDPSKPSLWESEANKDKTVALWDSLAERYADEPWIGGYDLINETNWSLGTSNAALRSLFVRITDSIRTVDPNHLLIIEGNNFANDFTGLTPPWDDNMAYSFHWYWTIPGSGSLDWIASLRDQQNVPVWLGESGENSNTWFTNVITLCESRNIGWSWWPVKKGGINNPMEVSFNEDYLQLLENWKGNGPMLSEDQAYQAVLTLAEQHRIENCFIHRDVVDAMIRQPHTIETLPFRFSRVTDTIYATEYDLGRNEYAYWDADTADYHGESGQDFTNWNQGWAFRNDGVDVETCGDLVTNGYSVGWTSAGEWLAYTVRSDSAAAYTLDIRSASGSTGSKIHLEVNGADATGTVALPSTGGWYNWRTTRVEDVILPEGKVELKFVFETAGSNLNWFAFSQPESDSIIPFRVLSASASGWEKGIKIFLNKTVTSVDAVPVQDFSMYLGGQIAVIDSVTINSDRRILELNPARPPLYYQTIKLSYDGTDIMHDRQELLSFTDLAVRNSLARYFDIPGTLQAESFYRNNGLVLESCTDVGGGSNTGYANPGDYLDYVVYVPEGGPYTVDFRVATIRSNAKVDIQADRGEGFHTIGSMSFSNTGGWQSWATQSTTLNMEAGKYLLRILVTGDEHNLNWISFSEPVGFTPRQSPASFTLYPNPASGSVWIRLNGEVDLPVLLTVIDFTGRTVFSEWLSEEQAMIDMTGWQSGIYIAYLGQKGTVIRRKFLVAGH
jgi:endoglucanase